MITETSNEFQFSYDQANDIFKIDGAEIHGAALRLLANGDPNWERLVYRFEKRPGLPTIAHCEYSDRQKTG